MKLLLLGATGRVGSRVLDQALAAGHDVTALVRDTSKLPQHPRLKAVAGDAHNSELLASLVAGKEAVIATLGHFGPKYDDVATVAAKTILASLGKDARYITMTGQVPDPHDPKQPLLGQLANMLIQALPGNVYGDGLSHYWILQSAPGNWVMGRFPRLSTGKGTGKYRAGYFPIGVLDTLSYDDAAKFLLDQLTSNDWLRQAPLVKR